MSKDSFTSKAQNAFNQYCSMGVSQFPPGHAMLQVALHRMFVGAGGYDATTSVNGILRKLTVLAYPISQAGVALVVRGIVVYLVNLCTCQRLDFFTLAEEGLAAYLEENKID